MSVFTTITQQELSTWLQNYSIGALVELKGISSGITNTNYFVTTQTNDGVTTKYVLTLFEQNNIEELPYYIDLMSHLAAHGIPCPKPIADLQGVCLRVLNGKPATLVSCLVGQDVQQPNLAQCAEVGRVLAQMHLAGQTFEAQFPQHFQLGNTIHNQRDADWRRVTAQNVFAKLSEEEQQLLTTELDYQQKDVYKRQAYSAATSTVTWLKPTCLAPLPATLSKLMGVMPKCRSLKASIPWVLCDSNT